MVPSGKICTSRRKGYQCRFLLTNQRANNIDSFGFGRQVNFYFHNDSLTSGYLSLLTNFKQNETAFKLIDSHKISLSQYCGHSTSTRASSGSRKGELLGKLTLLTGAGATGLKTASGGVVVAGADTGSAIVAVVVCSTGCLYHPSEFSWSRLLAKNCARDIIREYRIL
jgi:hypothetical protein